MEVHEKTPNEFSGSRNWNVFGTVKNPFPNRKKKKKSINLVIFSNVCTQHSDRLGLKNTYEGAEPELMLHFNHCLPETARAGPLKLPFFICFMFPLFYMV